VASAFPDAKATALELRFPELPRDQQRPAAPSDFESAEMEFVSGQLPRPRKDACDLRQLAALGADHGGLAVYKRRPEGVESLPRSKPACPELSSLLGSRLALRLLRRAN
jgi:hypothetical protein